MKIAIDFTSARSGGGIAYARGLLKGLAQSAAEDEFLLFVCTDQSQLRLELPANFTFRHPSIPSNRLFWRAAWQQLVLPNELERWGADVVYVPTELVPYSSPVPSVCMFQNWLPFVGLQEFRKMGFPARSFWKRGLQYVLAKLASRRARAVLFVSEASRDAISRELSLPDGKTEVVFHGIEDNGPVDGADRVFRSLPKAPYILVVADFLPHKNHRTLAVAYTRLVSRDGVPHHLVLVGRRWSREVSDGFRRIIDSSGLSDRVHVLESVASDQLPFIYDRAALLVLPSYVETFGFPVLEAMARGVPVAASRCSAAPEICRDSAMYFDPWSADEMADAIRKVLSDPAKGEELGRRGRERSREFVWAHTARRTLAVLKRAAMAGKAGTRKGGVS